MFLPNWLSALRARLCIPIFARASSRITNCPRRRLIPAPVAAAVQLMEDRIVLTAPLLTNSTYLGGSRNETVSDIATDDDGNTYVVGNSASVNLTPILATDDGRLRGFITKFDTSGNIVYTTYLGPVLTDSPYFTSSVDSVVISPTGAPIVSYEVTALSALNEGRTRHIIGAEQHVTELLGDGAPLFDQTVAIWTLGVSSSSIAVDDLGSVYLSSPNTTLLRTLSLPSKESARKTLDLMRFGEIALSLEGCRKNKESASRTNDLSLCQQKLLTTQNYFQWHATSAGSG